MKQELTKNDGHKKYQEPQRSLEATLTTVGRGREDAKRRRI
jgi:hypothetical protein